MAYKSELVELFENGKHILLFRYAAGYYPPSRTETYSVKLRRGIAGIAANAMNFSCASFGVVLRS